MRPISRTLLTAACGAAVLLGSGRMAGADVRYTTEMKVGGGDSEGAAPGAPTNSIRTTNYFKDRKERVETVMSFGPVQMHNISLTLCEKRQTIQMDPELKLYTVGPIGGNPMGMQGMVQRPQRPNAHEEKPGEGKMVMTYSVKEMGSEKIGELMTRHSMVTMRMQSSGCIGESDTTTRMELWVADIKTFTCPERFPTSQTVPNERGCHITYEMKGDVDAIREAFGGMIVREKIYQGDRVTMVQDLRDYSQAALDDALFTVPSGYREVSAEEYQRAEQQAMIRRIQGGAKGDDTNGNATPDEKAAPNDQSGGNPGDKSGDKPTDKGEDKPKKKKIRLPGIPGLPR